MNSIFLNSCDGAKKHYRYLGSGMNRDKGVCRRYEERKRWSCGLGEESIVPQEEVTFSALCSCEGMIEQ